MSRYSMESAGSRRSAGSSRRSGASFGSTVSDYSYQDDGETPTKSAYDEAEALRAAVLESEQAAAYDRIAEQLGAATVDDATDAAPDAGDDDDDDDDALYAATAAGYGNLTDDDDASAATDGDAAATPPVGRQAATARAPAPLAETLAALRPSRLFNAPDATAAAAKKIPAAHEVAPPASNEVRW
ncbi:hypothetical protein M885DRAFT_592086 [Pelagophyceae sp. CCMP2097]|nr:hypothetical protein M885DRAFT_592086 [Pelagophyceae sp. CCMP2097]